MYNFSIVNKRGKSIIISLSLFILTVVLLLVFFLTRPKDEHFSVDTSLSASVQNVELTVGEELYDFYSVNNPNAEISFIVDKNEIIDININRIKALRAGKVNVTLKASFKEEIVSKDFVVVVKEKQFMMTLECLSGCNYDEINSTLNVDQSYIKVF